VTSRQHLLRAAAIPLAALLLAIGATFLPDDPYQRYQQLQGTIHDTVRWTYERIHFDPTPIDVVVVGNSRTRLGLRAAQIEQRLAEAGKPAHVVNTSFVGEGRNSEWVYVEELFTAKHPKVVVVALSGRPHPWGHDTFRYIAPAAAVWEQARLGLYNGLKDLMYLPYRQIRLFAARLFPDAFGLTRTFDPVLYAATRTDFTHSGMTPDGRWIEMEKPVPAAELEKQAKQHMGNYRLKSKLPGKLRAVADADDHVYTAKIAEVARRHGAKVLFVFIPGYAESPAVQDRAFYEHMGPIQENPDLRGQAPLYQGWAHVNAQGASVVSDRVADQLARMLP
jgi:hypothetical protein